ncbi:MAG: RNA methyltransferase [Cyclobacteriaceae bacterium]
MKEIRKLKTEELSRVSVKEFEQQHKNNFVLVLDNIRSMHNVGATFRTADSFAAERVYLCGITAQPPHRDIHKTALGADKSVKWEYEKEIKNCIEKLKSIGYVVYVIEQTTNAASLATLSFDKDKKYAFVFGNEAFGISEEILPLADGAIEIPQYGTKHSLNVSVCVGIISWNYLAALS